VDGTLVRGPRKKGRQKKRVTKPRKRRPVFHVISGIGAKKKQRGKEKNKNRGGTPPSLKRHGRPSVRGTGNLYLQRPGMSLTQKKQQAGTVKREKVGWIRQ